MKKFLLLALFFCFASIDCAAFQKYLTANLNLRTGPGTKYNVTMVIPRGTAVTIDEDCELNMMEKLVIFQLNIYPITL